MVSENNLHLLWYIFSSNCDPETVLDLYRNADGEIPEIDESDRNNQQQENENELMDSLDEFLAAESDLAPDNYRFGIWAFIVASFNVLI